MLKATNPKDVIGSGKLPLELVPQTAVVEESLAYLEGASKYGRYNWRVGGVRTSIYAAAMLRHFVKWWNGEDADPDTRVPHLASMRACLGIMIDARECGKLTDDRPPPAPLGRMIAAAEQIATHVRAMFADKSPKQWTIADVISADDAERIGSLSDAMAHTAAQVVEAPEPEPEPSKRERVARILGIDADCDEQNALDAVERFRRKHGHGAFLPADLDIALGLLGCPPWRETIAAVQDLWSQPHAAPGHRPA